MTSEVIPGDKLFTIPGASIYQFDVLMPPELRRAHQNNDRAVMAAYGFPVKGFTEADCVAELMKLYQKMVQAEAE